MEGIVTVTYVTSEDVYKCAIQGACMQQQAHRDGFSCSSGDRTDRSAAGGGFWSSLFRKGTASLNCAMGILRSDLIAARSLLEELG